MKWLWQAGCWGAILLCVTAGRVQAEPPYPLLVEGRYFHIYAPRDIAVPQLLEQLHPQKFVSLASVLDAPAEDPRQLLGQTFDALFLEASGVLGINMFTFKADVFLLPAQQDVSEAFADLTGMPFTQPAFYWHENQSLYLAVDDIQLGIVGHEIAHTILSHYFGIPPPPKVQEILCGYVEYQFLKTAGLLSTKNE